MANPYFGVGERCFIVAEVGANHNGDAELATRSIEEAKRAGADAVKFQYYTSRDLVADPDRVWTWGRPDGRQVAERIGDVFDRLALSRESLARIYSSARAMGVTIFCTPFSVAGVADLEDLGNPIYKVASSDLCFFPMLDAIAGTGRPVIVSSGKSELREVHEALPHLRAVPREDVALLHCVAKYPAPLESMNIRVVETFQREFRGHPIGLSDHCTSNDPALAAVALGAVVVEKHFTLDRELPGPDHWFSSDPAAFSDLVRGVRNVENSLGDGVKQIAEPERWEATYSKRSIIVMQRVLRGEVVTKHHLELLRPGTGLHPRHLGEVIGRCARRDIAAGEPLTWEMLE